MRHFFNFHSVSIDRMCGAALLGVSFNSLCSVCALPQWGAADAEIIVPSGDNTEFKRSPFKPGVGQCPAIHATLTARDFFLE